MNELSWRKVSCYYCAERNRALWLANVYSESLHFEKAKEHFVKAHKIASAQKLRKHQVNAHLSLAELALKCLDTRAAWNHYNEATKRVVPENRFPDSKYLVDKRDRLKKSLGETNSFHVSYEDFIRDGKPWSFHSNNCCLYGDG